MSCNQVPIVNENKLICILLQSFTGPTPTLSNWYDFTINFTCWHIF